MTPGVIVAAEWLDEYGTFGFYVRDDSGAIRTAAPAIFSDCEQPRFYLGGAALWFKLGYIDINGLTKEEILAAIRAAELPTLDGYLEMQNK